MSSTAPKLFQPLRVGTANLQHRVVLAPMTRCRADAQHVHGALGLEYYKQRTSVPGTLAITEATFIAARAGGMKFVPGIWSDKQIAAWKSITDVVHANSSSIFLQLWSLGRTAKPGILQEEGGYPLVAPSAIPLNDNETPRPLTVEEIKEYVQLHATAAKNAVLKAGFDGVEIHAANGYLPDQFIQTNTNARTDEYGGSIENRVRFVLEVADAVVKAVGANKVGIRFSPWSTYQGMRMSDPIPTFAEVVRRLRDSHPDLAYIHVLEPPPGDNSSVSNRILRDIWGNRPYIASAGFERESAIEMVEKEGGLVSFARHFLSNPDLPFRLKENIELAPYNRETFYTKGAKGYTDYPFAAEANSTGNLKSRY
ncbi:putative NADPH2 dehydrogenase chain OYE2 [Lactarius quietus]|nr:putative NADPH2 dehydrogenase chain OYE2 [Lactarius quietus]